MKRWILVQLAVVVIVAAAGQLWKATVPDDTFRTQEDTLNKGFDVEYVMGADDYNSLVNYPEQNDTLVNDAAVIIVGKPTGNIFQEGAIFGQEIVIEEILKGSDNLRAAGFGETLYVFGADGFYDVYEDGNIRYMGGFGLMQKSSSYLIFLEDVGYDLLFPVKGYWLFGGFYGRLRVDEPGAKSPPVTVPAEELSYDDVWDYEYIAESQKVLDEVYRMKEHVLELVRNAGLRDFGELAG
ncbi:MAG: hypothetical protein LBL36_04185 [Clostridiales Family XIII bacterium]|jgi:hypothetical protein|nr:hypothetical protein [Clostridiales Family XIII bacterium]